MDWEASLTHHRGSTHSTPPWVKVTGVMVGALLLFFVAPHLVGLGHLGHRFGGHGDHGGQSSATERGPQQP
jgi:hypothetical protein